MIKHCSYRVVQLHASRIVCINSTVYMRCQVVTMYVEDLLGISGIDILII